MAHINYQVIYDIVKLIPSGRVTTYGAIAEAIGLKGAARMVGYALSAAHNNQKVPAHRVVNRNGLLTGKHHFNPPSQMQELLEKEGIEVKDDKIVYFNAKFWDPISII